MIINRNSSVILISNQVSGYENFYGFLEFSWLVVLAALASSSLILVLDLSEQLYLIDKTKKQVDKQIVFSPQKYPNICFFKQSLTCLFLINLIYSDNRINELKNGFDI